MLNALAMPTPPATMQPRTAKPITVWALPTMVSPGELARILWHLLKFKQPFNPEVYAKEEAKMKRRKVERLQNLAASLNYQLVPQP